MSIFDENSLDKAAYSNITGAAGSNQSMDLNKDMLGTRPQDPGKDLAKQLLICHPTYQENKEKWLKYLDLYESNDIYRFVFRHLRESEGSWKKRVERGYYNNYVASVVDLLTSYLFASPVDRNIQGFEDIFTETFYKNVDFKGTPYDTFMEDVATYTRVEGHVGIWIDSPEDAEDMSERDRIDGDVRPYLTLLHPHQILDYKLDRYGRFEWAKFVLCRDPERSWDRPADESAKTVVVVSKDSYEVYDVDGKAGYEQAVLVRSSPNPLGEVPLVIAKYRTQARHPWYGVSPIRDIADINIGILNWSSLGDNEIYERCLNILVMEKASDDSTLELSHDNILEYEGTNPPAFIFPGVTPLELIQKWIQFHIDDILRLAKLKGPTGMSDVREATSGIAYAFEFNETNQTLANNAKSLERVDYEIHRIVAKFFGEEFTGSIAYPRDFGVEDILVLMQGLTIAREALTTETGIKELEKKVVRSVFAKLPTDLRKEIEDEVDEAEAKPQMDSIFNTQPGGGSPMPGMPEETTSEPASDEESEPRYSER